MIKSGYNEVNESVINEAASKRSAEILKKMDDIDSAVMLDDSDIESILTKNHASEDDSGEEGYFAGMSDADIRKAWDEIKKNLQDKVDKSYKLNTGLYRRFGLGLNKSAFLKKYKKMKDNTPYGEGYLEGVADVISAYKIKAPELMNESLDMNESSDDEWDSFGGKKYYVSGSTSNFPGEISAMEGPIRTDDPKKAIEAYFKINRKFPTETSIQAKTKKDALELLKYADSQETWIRDMMNKYRHHYKPDYFIEAIKKKVADGCKYFHDSKYGDMIYPFDIG